MIRVKNLQRADLSSASGGTARKSTTLSSSMDYMDVIKRSRELYHDVSESDFADGIEKFWGNETFSKWCYLSDLLPEEVLDEIKNIK